MTALVIGGARCVWDDIVAARPLGPYSMTIVVNDMISHWPGVIDYAVTLHPEKMSGWLIDRAKWGLGAPMRTASHASDGGTGFTPDLIMNHKTHRTMSLGASSGLFATLVAMENKKRAVLCGVPMMAEEAHFFCDDYWEDVSGFIGEWDRMKTHIAPYVRSMSGWTRGLLGEPTKEWVHGDF